MSTSIQKTGGGPQMVKIDGDRVKALREQQGLTQLYVATAVGVTTDTISRWENKRYPTIKRENGLKLAEALEVELIAILEDSTADKLEESAPKPPPQEIAETPKQQSTDSTSRFNKPVLGTIITVALLLILGLALFFTSQNRSQIIATRYAPAHVIAGQPFPVIIEVVSNDQFPYVVKETIPANCKLLTTFPQIQLGKLKDHTIKWLKKDQQGSKFIYVGSLTASASRTAVKFRGIVSGTSGKKVSMIEGVNQTAISTFHWADTDTDNRISDQEILEAYDRFNGIPSINFEEIEEIWMGTGYRWDATAHKIIIL